MRVPSDGHGERTAVGHRVLAHRAVAGLVDRGPVELHAIDAGTVRPDRIHEQQAGVTEAIRRDLESTLTAQREAYLAHPVPTLAERQADLRALARLLPEPLVRVHAPTASIVTLNAQPRHNRWVLHLLYYVPERRCDEYDVIEDVTPLYDVAVSIQVTQPVKNVSLVPQHTALPFTCNAGRVTFTVPKIEGHQMIELILS